MALKLVLFRALEVAANALLPDFPAAAFGVLGFSVVTSEGARIAS